MASQVADCSTPKPVAVVAPLRRVTEPAAGRSPTTSKCEDATERRRHPAAAASVPRGHDERHRCSENTEDAPPSSDVGQSRRPAGPDDDVDDDLTTCPFYHGNITSDEAKRRLANAARGTYLLRDSQSPDFPLSLSVRTSGRSGVTSLRIARVAGGNRFRLDCAEAHRATMPTFDGALRLVRHFVGTSDGGDGGQCVLVGASGCREQPLTLRQPLHRPPINDD